jgi:hypothetical protein
MLVLGGLITFFNEELLQPFPRRQAESVVAALSFTS